MFIKLVLLVAVAASVNGSDLDQAPKLVVSLHKLSGAESDAESKEGYKMRGGPIHCHSSADSLEEAT